MRIYRNDTLESWTPRKNQQKITPREDSKEIFAHQEVTSHCRSNFSHTWISCLVGIDFIEIPKRHRQPEHHETKCPAKSSKNARSIDSLKQRRVTLFHYAYMLQRPDLKWIN